MIIRMRTIIALQLFTLIIKSSDAFQLLPYVYIDYRFYLKLAECQSKCAAKFGKETPKTMLNGNSHFSLNKTETYLACCNGCNSGDSQKSRSSNDVKGLENMTLTETAFLNGQSLWAQINHESQDKSNEEQKNQKSASPVKEIRVLCIQKSSTGYMSSLESLIAVDFSSDQGESKGIFRHYVVQWKHKSEKNEGEETNWITASIESNNIFKVEKIQTGIAYRFAITVVSEVGKHGPAIQSGWLRFSEYNSDNNVGVLVQFKSNEEKIQRSNTTKRSSNRRLRSYQTPIFSSLETTILPRLYSKSRKNPPSESHTISQSVVLPYCCLQFNITNATTETVSEHNIDNSDGIFAGNLAFNTKYVVQIRSCEIQQYSTDVSLKGTFTSIHCWSIYGPGSLECDPEPVKDLEISLDSSNLTMSVAWALPSYFEETGFNYGTENHEQNILFYEITIQSRLNSNSSCSFTPTTRVIRPPIRLTSFPLPINRNKNCELEVTVITYDLLGKQASNSKKIIFSASKKLHEESKLGKLLSRYLDVTESSEPTIIALLSLIVLIPVAAIFTLVCTLKQSSNNRAKLKHFRVKNSKEPKKVRTWLKPSGETSTPVSLTTGLSQTISPSVNGEVNPC